ncbi:MAG: arsenate reductase [Cohaesibacter sp.]|nr:arsenate reductase [Cohaesibacter sp.]MCV6603504.1 arsenate reductase [Cohaesibacter sp.]
MNIYGIKTCDTCRKALKSFDAAGKSHHFVDFRVDGLSEGDLDRWLAAVGWEILLNRRSTSWRALSEDEKAHPDQDKARALMLANPTLIKRPVFDDGKRVIVGFGKKEQSALLD